MAGSVSSPIVIHLLNIKGELVHQITRDYMEVRGVAIIRYDGNYFLFEVGTGLSYYTFRQIEAMLDLDEVKGTVELKVYFERDPRALDHMLFLLQHNEISLGKAKEIVEHWCAGYAPLSSDLPVVSQDNPLVSENDAPMDVLREVREDIIKKRETDVKYAAYLAAFVDRYQISMNENWIEGLNKLVEYLTVDAHGKPTTEELRAKYTIKVGHPMLSKKFAYGLEEGPKEEFVFRITEDGSLTPEMKEAGARVEYMAGIGKVVVMPIKQMFDGPVRGKEMKWMPVDALGELEAGLELAMKQFSDTVKGVLQKFHETP